MKYNEIKEVIKWLAKSQGFYGRLLETFENTEEDKEHFKQLKEVLEGRHFKDALEIVEYFES